MNENGKTFTLILQSERLKIYPCLSHKHKGHVASHHKNVSLWYVTHHENLICMISYDNSDVPSVSVYSSLFASW